MAEINVSLQKKGNDAPFFPLVSALFPAQKYDGLHSLVQQHTAATLSDGDSHNSQSTI